MPKAKLTKPRRLREPKCPECNKVKRVRPQSQAIGEFIDWLAHEKNIILAHSHKHDDACYTQGMTKREFRREMRNRADDDELKAGRCEHPQCGLRQDELYFTHVNIEKLLADFFDIDLKKQAAEQDALLAYIRAKGAERELDAKVVELDQAVAEAKR